MLALSNVLWPGKIGSCQIEVWSVNVLCRIVPSGKVWHSRLTELICPLYIVQHVFRCACCTCALAVSVNRDPLVPHWRPTLRSRSTHESFEICFCDSPSPEQKWHIFLLVSFVPTAETPFHKKIFHKFASLTEPWTLEIRQLPGGKRS